MRKIGQTCLLLAGVALPLGTARAQGCASPLPATAGTPPIQITPVTFRILQSSLMPVPATDGLLHLAYAALMTNVSHDT
ncbi:MAG: hypothetical protein QOF90_3563, partial [Acetobacteraceae bacterium]|nr:hypothetical protein [Acetobacteraceae bacterium]